MSFFKNDTNQIYWFDIDDSPSSINVIAQFDLTIITPEEKNEILYPPKFTALKTMLNHMHAIFEEEYIKNIYHHDFGFGNIGGIGMPFNTPLMNAAANSTNTDAIMLGSWKDACYKIVFAWTEQLMSGAIPPSVFTTEFISVNLPQVIDFTSPLTMNLPSTMVVKESTDFVGATPTVTGNIIGTLVYAKSSYDAGQFNINPETGVITMDGKDYQNPSDANGDNVYEVTITVTDGDNKTAHKDQVILVIK